MLDAGKALGDYIVNLCSSFKCGERGDRCPASSLSNPFQALCSFENIIVMSGALERISIIDTYGKTTPLSILIRVMDWLTVCI
jgi:hypothetical protein